MLDNPGVVNVVVIATGVTTVQELNALDQPARESLAHMARMSRVSMANVLDLMLKNPDTTEADWRTILPICQGVDSAFHLYADDYPPGPSECIPLEVIVLEALGAAQA